MPDKQMILDHLRLAEIHVSLGQEHIVRQRQLVAELERDGHDPGDAGKLLAQFALNYRTATRQRDGGAVAVRIRKAR